ncbi:hypothetical protein V6Z11_D02G104900 [Gossypium hirsutum]|uniref:Methyltransferase n=1 Tax=Gossypium hirsutum TaxID=3635 RepID=A0ABM2ZPC9_GOSHI|nr:uncharacterized protein LOC107944899 isoform X3 [Gossypium hirsutum]
MSRKSLNKILHSRIEAMHIQFAEKDRGSALAELVTVSGIGNNWCEGFSTYPRTYDLIHANGVFSLYQDKIGSNGLENSIGKKVCVMHTRFENLFCFRTWIQLTLQQKWRI